MEAIATEAASSVASRIANFIADLIKRRVYYLIFYKRKVNNLKEELQKLNFMKTGVKRLVDAAVKNLEEPNPAVVSWQKQADDVQHIATEFLENEIKRNDMYCLKGMCPNPRSRYSSGRKAVKLTENVVTLLQEAEKFKDQIACPASPPKTGSAFSTEGIKLFESRQAMENEVWEALKNDELPMISICGMGGVGKTTLVKKLLKRVQDEKLFGEVAMAVVSQKDLETIQEEIAEQLGLKLKDEKTLPVKAAKLHERIQNSGKSILLILDDVWKELDFEAIGLPAAGAKGRYKIVMTSRNEDVCNRMGSKKNFPIHVLTKEKAWELFKEMVGNSIDSELHQTATEVVDECGGFLLPL